MKTINEIREQYPFFSNASQPSAPGEIFINRHLLSADIIMVGYRDELRGCTVKSRISIPKAERWYLNIANAYDRMNTDILRLIDSHPTAFFNVMDSMTFCSTNEYGNDFANSFSVLPTFINLEEALHTLRLNKAMEESLRHIVESPSTQDEPLVDYPLAGRTIYPIGKIAPDPANVTYISIAPSDDMAMPSLIVLFNAYEEHLYLTLVIETHLEKAGAGNGYQLRAFSSALSDSADALGTLYGELDAKLGFHGILSEPYGRSRKYTLPSNLKNAVHIFPTFVSSWGTVNLCAAVHQDGAPCKYIGYTNMSYGADVYYCSIDYCQDYLERLVQIVLEELQ